jgi:regulator of replication initiation timing
MSDQDRDDDFRDDYREEARELLSTIEQVEETLSVMTSVVGQLKEQVATHLDEDDTHTIEMSAEEFLEQCENLEGTWH